MSIPRNDDTFADAEQLDHETERRWKSIHKAWGRKAGQLTVLSEAQVTLPASGITATMFKVVDDESGESRRLAIDPKGRALDVDDLLERERAAVRERFGNLQPALFDLIAGSDDDDAELPVLIFYAVDDEPTDLDKREFDTAELDDERIDALGQRARRRVRSVAKRAAAMHAEVAGRRDTRPRERDRANVSGPFVRARLPVRVLRELSRDERIAFIGMDDEKEILDYPTCLLYTSPSPRDS